YTLYPNDTRFIDGINEGAQLLLTWATKQHQNSQYATAIDRYDHILDAPGVDSTIKKETEIKRSYAVQGGGIPSADWLYNQAVANTTASGTFDLFERGYYLYPNNQNLVSGYKESAESLFDWATIQQNKGNFSTAIDRYKKVLTTPFKAEQFYQLIDIQLRYANNKEVLPEIIFLGTVEASNLYVREGPSTTNDSIGILSRNDYIEILETVNANWFKINYNGTIGYVASAYITSQYTPTSPNAGPLTGRTIILDAGHGGKDPGASSNGMLEKNIVLDITLRAQQLLIDSGATVILTRSRDEFIELSERAKIANNSDADIFISIHANRYDGIANGTETFWHSNYERNDSVKLANALQISTVKKLGTNYRRVAEGDYHVIRETKIPSALLEVAFLDNDIDAMKLAQFKYRQLSAEAIQEGVINYFK
ncbi:N-acetylmuramoyl-L-alanine amidase, partial [Paraliobacillus zengyii]|uniref:N-acetylmuramoyl-L-alanine amidase n=1 Tax=Paraliobacillus zengyii TaxID=2213194 RepID=UPI001300BBF9